MSELQEALDDISLSEYLEVAFDGNAASVTPDERAKLAPLLKFYAGKPHPFGSCVKDNRKRFGGLTEKYCAVIKDLIVGNTHWRNGGKKKASMSASEIADFAVEMPREFIHTLSELTVEDAEAIVAELEEEEDGDDDGNDDDTNNQAISETSTSPETERGEDMAEIPQEVKINAVYGMWLARNRDQVPAISLRLAEDESCTEADIASLASYFSEATEDEADYMLLGGDAAKEWVSELADMPEDHLETKKKKKKKKLPPQKAPASASYSNFSQMELEVDAAYQLPMGDFSEPEKVAPNLWWKQILPYGRVKYGGGELNFDKKFASELITNFNAEDKPFDQVPAFEVNDDNEHKMGPGRVQGWVKALKARDQGIFALIETNKAGTAHLTDTNPKVGVSARVRWNWKRPFDDKYFGTVLEHVALTTLPHIPKMAEWEPATAEFSQELQEAEDLTDATWTEGGVEVAIEDTGKPEEVTLEENTETDTTEGRDMSETENKNGGVDLSSLDPNIQAYITDMADKQEKAQKRADLALERLEETNRERYEEKTRSEVRDLVKENGHGAVVERIAVELCLTEKARDEIQVDLSDSGTTESVSARELVMRLLKETSGTVPSENSKGDADLSVDTKELSDEDFVSVLKKGRD